MGFNEIVAVAIGTSYAAVGKPLTQLGFLEPHRSAAGAGLCPARYEKKAGTETAVAGSLSDVTEPPLARRGLTGEPGVSPCF